MNLRRTLLLGGIVWVALISALHGWLNLGLIGKAGPQAATTFKVGFLPVT